MSIDTRTNNNLYTQMSYYPEDKTYFDPDLLNLDLERIRIFINILEEHEENCERDEKFPEAALTRSKIKLLKDVEEVKILTDLNKFQDEQVSSSKALYITTLLINH